MVNGEVLVGSHALPFRIVYFREFIMRKTNIVITPILLVVFLAINAPTATAGHCRYCMSDKSCSCEKLLTSLLRALEGKNYSEKDSKRKNTGSDSDESDSEPMPLADREQERSYEEERFQHSGGGGLHSLNLASDRDNIERAVGAGIAAQGGGVSIGSNFPFWGGISGAGGFFGTGENQLLGISKSSGSMYVRGGGAQQPMSQQQLGFPLAPPVNGREETVMFSGGATSIGIQISLTRDKYKNVEYFRHLIKSLLNGENEVVNMTDTSDISGPVVNSLSSSLTTHTPVNLIIQISAGSVNSAGIVFLNLNWVDGGLAGTALFFNQAGATEPQFILELINNFGDIKKIRDRVHDKAEGPVKIGTVKSLPIEVDENN